MVEVINRDNLSLNELDIWKIMKSKEKHHNHGIILIDGIYRWEKIIEHTDYNINELWSEWTKKGLTKNSEEIRDFYRKIGYSLYGYWELFYWELNNPEADDYKR